MMELTENISLAKGSIYVNPTLAQDMDSARRTQEIPLAISFEREYAISTKQTDRLTRHRLCSTTYRATPAV